MSEQTAIVKRFPSASGDRDADYFSAKCPKCLWGGAFHNNRTIEGQKLAERDARDHRCNPVHPQYT